MELTDIAKEIKSIEPVDELITLNKEYQELCETHDKAEELINALKKNQGKEKQIKSIEKMQEDIRISMQENYSQSQMIVFGQRMFKVTMMLKAVKSL